MNTRQASWASTALLVTLGGLALVAVRADEDPPNTGMADPVALVTAFDRFAAAGDDRTPLVLSLSIRNLRAARSEWANPSSLPPSFRN